MNDCLFENCKFEDVIIEQGENIAGSYANCHFDKVKFEKVIFSDSGKEEKLEVYKNTEFYLFIYIIWYPILHITAKIRK